MPRTLVHHNFLTASQLSLRRCGAAIATTAFNNVKLHRAGGRNVRNPLVRLRQILAVETWLPVGNAFGRRVVQLNLRELFGSALRRGNMCSIAFPILPYQTLGGQ